MTTTGILARPFMAFTPWRGVTPARGSEPWSLPLGNTGTDVMDMNGATSAGTVVKAYRVLRAT